MSEIVINVKNISKSFTLPHERANSVKGLFLNPFRSKLKNAKETQQALEDISFEVKKGEFFGIVGRNGSGKSTLLKILAGIYQPNSGTVSINGRLVPFIELGVGFNPELTGRENVYLNGALLGFSQKEIDQKYSKIVDFAELERFMDQRLKNYSSGMQVRLAFSVATILAESDILLIDEVLAVGDADFQRKCFNYFKKLKREGKTVVFVSHDMEAVREYCDRALLIDGSKVIDIGRTSKIAEMYIKLFNFGAISASDTKDSTWGSGEIETMTTKTVVDDNDINITQSYKGISAKNDYIVGFRIRSQTGSHILGTNTKVENFKTESILPGQIKNISWTFSNILSDGEYIIDTAIQESDGITVIEWRDEAATFKVEKSRHVPYSVDLKYRIE